MNANQENDDPTRTATCPLPPGKGKYSTDPCRIRGSDAWRCVEEPWRECAGLYKAGINAYFKSKEEIFTPCANVR